MPEIEPQLRTLPLSDGYPVLVATWRPEERTRGRVVVLHGVQSHQGWYHGLGRRLAARGYEAHFPDRRGSGGNTLDRGHASSAGRLVTDVGEVLASLDGDAPTALVGISWGGKPALVAASRFPKKIAALVLIGPGVQPRVGVSLKEKLRIALALVTNPRKRFPIPLNDPSLFTASPEGQRFIAEDPLGLREATAGTLAASFFLDRQLAKIPPTIRQPVLLMLAGEDRIVDNALIRAYFDKLASRDRKIIEYPGAHHTLEFEPDPSVYATDIADWLDDRIGA